MARLLERLLLLLCEKIGADPRRLLLRALISIAFALCWASFWIAAPSLHDLYDYENASNTRTLATRPLLRSTEARWTDDFSIISAIGFAAAALWWVFSSQSLRQLCVC